MRVPGLATHAQQVDSSVELRIKYDVPMQALAFYDRLAEGHAQSMPEVWSRLAGCHQALGNYDAAVGAHLKVLEGDSTCNAFGTEPPATALMA